MISCSTNKNAGRFDYSSIQALMNNVKMQSASTNTSGSNGVTHQYARSTSRGKEIGYSQASKLSAMLGKGPSSFMQQNGGIRASVNTNPGQAVIANHSAGNLYSRAPNFHPRPAATRIKMSTQKDQNDVTATVINSLRSSSYNR